MDVQATVKRRMGYTDGTHDAEIAEAIVEIELRVRHYCNIKKIPEELQPTIVRMVVELLKRDAGASIEGLSSIKVGDTQISMGVGGATPNADAVLIDYRADLIAFRRVGW